MSTATASPATTVQAVEAAHVLQTYKRQPVVFVRGEGVWLVADDGRATSTCCRASASTCSGTRTRRWSPRSREQVGELVHTSNLFFHPYQGTARREARRRPPGCERAFFCNSGAEAVEGCLKFARRYWYTAGTPRRAVHRLRARASPAGRWARCRPRGTSTTATPFGPLVPEVRFVVQRRSRTTCCRPSATRPRRSSPSRSRARAACVRCRRRSSRPSTRPCAATGALYIADEVQSGLGRTGQPVPLRRHSACCPDLISVGKALGGGVPIGAVLVSAAGRRDDQPPATTARPTAATRWPAAPRWPCSTRSSSGLLEHVRQVGAESWPTGCARWRRSTRWSSRCAAPA